MKSITTNTIRRLSDVNGKTIVEHTGKCGTWYADKASGEVYNITVKNVPGCDRYAINVTYRNPETGRRFNRSHNVYLVDFLNFYADSDEHYNDEDLWQLVASFMRDFLQNHVFCTSHTGKMTGLHSCSTSAAKNARCQARANCNNDECICRHCFALAQMAYQKSMGLKYVRNTEILTGLYIQPNWIPEETSNDIFRFESFGDLANVQQIENYCTIAAERPNVTHTLWTKNPDIIADYIADGGRIPKNMIIIYSSPLVNHCAAGILEKYPFISKTFTVWTDEEAAKAADVTINCGARSCNTCRRCYTPGPDTVNELLK